MWGCVSARPAFCCFYLCVGVPASRPAYVPLLFTQCSSTRFSRFCVPAPPTPWPLLQTVKVHKAAVGKFMGRIQNLGNMLGRLLGQVAKGAEPPEQLPAFKTLLEKARAAIKVGAQGRPAPAGAGSGRVFSWLSYPCDRGQMVCSLGPGLHGTWVRVQNVAGSW